MDYALKMVCGYLGVPPDTVRKWEARYPGLVEAEREGNGYRRYSEADLQRLLAFAESRRAGIPGAEAARRAAASAAARRAPISRRATALAAFERFDRRAALTLYKDSTRGRSLQAAFTELWLPVLVELGSRAHEGAPVWISVEHFASAFLRERVLADLAERAPDGPTRLALCAPEGDRHELGMLLAACTLEASGVGCLYLGADLPLASLEAALDRASPQGLSLTLTAERPRRELKALLDRLRRRFPRLELFICGQESLRHANLIRELGAVFVGTDLGRGARRIRETLEGRRR